MKVRLKTLMAGPAGVVQPGQVADLPDDLARAVVAAGSGELVDVVAPPIAPSTIETAAIAPPEAAVTRSGRPRGR